MQKNTNIIMSVISTFLRLFVPFWITFYNLSEINGKDLFGLEFAEKLSDDVLIKRELFASYMNKSSNNPISYSAVHSLVSWHGLSFIVTTIIIIYVIIKIEALIDNENHIVTIIGNELKEKYGHSIFNVSLVFIVLSLVAGVICSKFVF